MCVRQDYTEQSTRSTRPIVVTIIRLRVTTNQCVRVGGSVPVHVRVSVGGLVCGYEVHTSVSLIKPGTKKKNRVNKNSETVNRLCSVRIGNVLHKRGTYIGKQETRRKEARSGEREGGNHH